MLRQPLVLHLARTHGVASLMAARGVSCDQAIVGSLLLMFRSRQQSRAATACCCLAWAGVFVDCGEFAMAGVLSLSTQRRQRRQERKKESQATLLFFFLVFLLQLLHFFTCAYVCTYCRNELMYV